MAGMRIVVGKRDRIGEISLFLMRATARYVNGNHARIAGKHGGAVMNSRHSGMHGSHGVTLLFYNHTCANERLKPFLGQFPFDPVVAVTVLDEVLPGFELQPEEVARLRCAGQAEYGC